jgi:hypothetical protein
MTKLSIRRVVSATAGLTALSLAAPRRFGRRSVRPPFCCERRDMSERCRHCHGYLLTAAV